MATITIRVSEETRAEVDEIARGRGVSVSDLLRSALDDVIGRDPERGPDGPLSLSRVERLTLKMQHEILAKLGDDEAMPPDHHRKMIEVLEQGFTGEYGTLFSGISEVTQRECALVWDLLDMFRILKASVAKLNPADRATLGEYAERALTFQGFDFNDSREARLASYAEHLVSDGRWQELAECFDDAHESGNSHARELPTYQRLLRAFTPIWRDKVSDHSGGPERYLLTPAELATVYAAWPNPR